MPIGHCPNRPQVPCLASNLGTANPSASVGSLPLAVQRENPTGPIIGGILPFYAHHGCFPLYSVASLFDAKVLKRPPKASTK